MGYTSGQHRPLREGLEQETVSGAPSPKEPGDPFARCSLEHSLSVLQQGSDPGSQVVGQSLRIVALRYV